MKTINLFFSFIFILSFISCDHDDVNGVQEGNDENMEISLRGKISMPQSDVSFSGCKVTTITKEITLNENSDFEIPSLVNNCVQSFFVNDGNNVYLMARIPTNLERNLILDAQSTAIALVTMHPLFAAIKADEYEEVVQMITNCNSYTNLLGEVEKAIEAKRNIYDDTNEDMLQAYGNLMEELCGEVEDENQYSDELDIIPTTEQTRAIYENAKIYPLYAETNGNVLTLRNTGLTPSYYGTVSHANGTDAISVLSRGDYGGLDIFKTVGEINLGPEVNYTFSHEGEFHFNLSRTNEAATADFFLRIANCLLTSLGLDLGNDAIQAIGNSISVAIINAGSGVHDEVIDPMEWVGIAYNATLEQLKTGTFFQHSVSESLAFTSKFLLGSLNWYNKIKGVGNAAVRIGFALSAPEELNFCLCYYENEISTCTEASLTKTDGDMQTGYAGQKLLLPLTVYVTTLGDDGIYVSPSSYHRVKFEVVEGGGSVDNEYVSANSENIASTYWTLGEDGEQVVKAVVVDVITDKEISNAEYFVATLTNAEVTVRLDWSQHNDSIDIDLHVIDPYGEEICYYNMNSASGGYLQGDDYGPGPGSEHIYWSNAPAGIYRIYVHYYPNNDESKPVANYSSGNESKPDVNYKVSVTADGITYRPVTGFISYGQMIPVGQFTVGGNQTRSSLSAPDANMFIR